MNRRGRCPGSRRDVAALVLFARMPPTCRQDHQHIPASQRGGHSLGLLRPELGVAPVGTHDACTWAGHQERRNAHRVQTYLFNCRTLCVQQPAPQSPLNTGPPGAPLSAARSVGAAAGGGCTGAAPAALGRAIGAWSAKRTIAAVRAGSFECPGLAFKAPCLGLSALSWAWAVMHQMRQQIAKYSVCNLPASVCSTFGGRLRCACSTCTNRVPTGSAGCLACVPDQAHLVGKFSEWSVYPYVMGNRLGEAGWVLPCCFSDARSQEPRAAHVAALGRVALPSLGI